jgi:hypothetical protein
MFSRSQPPENPKGPQADSSVVDIGKRYDVYCNPHGQPIVVYRNVLFRGTRTLFGQGDHFDRISQFVELEHPDGRCVFVSRMSVVAFCEQGASLGSESPNTKG